jgi:hypothetical protein
VVPLPGAVPTAPMPSSEATAGHQDDEDRDVRTYSPKASELTRSWHVLDADGVVLGRLATEVARLLRGKHRPYFAPHLDTGDAVIIVNAAKVRMTANKAACGRRRMSRCSRPVPSRSLSAPSEAWSRTRASAGPR